MKGHLVKVAVVLFVLGFGSIAMADNYQITVSNVALCVAATQVCYGDVNGSFDYSATGTPGASGPATSINLNLTPINGSTFSTSFDTFVSGEQFPSPNGSEIYFNDAAGNQFAIGIPFLPTLSGLVFEGTTLSCASAACLAVFGTAGGIDFGVGAGGSFTAIDLGSTQPPPPAPEPSTLLLLSGALVAGLLLWLRQSPRG